MSDELTELQHLARAYGIETSFYDVTGHEQVASIDSLRAVLGALGCEVDGGTDLVAAYERRRRERLERFLEPVRVLEHDGVLVSIPTGCTGFDCVLRLEDGSESAWGVAVDKLEVLREETVGGDTYRIARLPLLHVPHGYHTLRIDVGGRSFEAMILHAPPRMWSPPDADRTRWGVFLPLYAAHGEDSWGRGDYTDFRRLLDWTGERGGDFVGTLPLLANEWEHGIDPSPYAPTSRRFWNEFHLDPRRCVEYAACEEARAVVESSEFREAMGAARSERLVDYETLVPLHRRVVERLAEYFFRSTPGRRAELRTWLARHEEVDRFAQYRARGEATKSRWPDWQAVDVNVDETLDFDTRAYQYHMYAQWQTTLQIEELGRDAASALYLDFPLGVRRDGYDAWRDPGAFALTASGGAPPDPFFTKGQDWGFPPLHPDGVREARYRPWIEGLRAHLGIARLLRIDHAMGLHRLFWVPVDGGPADGVYVRYEAPELFAILSLESHRHEAVLIGENLGTCPPEVNHAMESSGMPGMYVVEFEINPHAHDGNVLNRVPDNVLTCMNTHDLPTFHAFWNGLDVDDHLDLGLVDEAEAEATRHGRAGMRDAVVAYLAREGYLAEGETAESAVLEACLRWLVDRRPAYVIANLEDAWGEPLPQNSPGTWKERPNWRRRSALSLEEIASDDRVRSMLETISTAAADNSR